MLGSYSELATSFFSFWVRQVGFIYCFSFLVSQWLRSGGECRRDDLLCFSNNCGLSGLPSGKWSKNILNVDSITFVNVYCLQSLRLFTIKLLISHDSALSWTACQRLWSIVVLGDPGTWAETLLSALRFRAPSHLITLWPYTPSTALKLGY